MKFIEATSKCYRKYFVFKGRASRSEYWWFFLLGFLFAWPLALSEFETGTLYSILTFIYFMLTLSVVIPGAAVWTRRMHDIGMSGWSWLFLLIPIAGQIIMLVWLTKKGDAVPNKYGEPDNEPYVRAPSNG